MKPAGLFRAVEGYESRILLSATTTSSDEADAVGPLEPGYSAILSTYTTSADTTTGSLAEQSGTTTMASLPDDSFGLQDLSGSAMTAGTELGPIVSPYSTQIDEAASGFSTTAMSTWQETQQPTSDPQFTTVASPGTGDSATTTGDSGTTDPWMAAFFDNGQTSTTGSTASDSEVIEQQSANDDDAATETTGDEAGLPEPTVSGGFTTTTTVNGGMTTTTYTLTSSISLESGSMAGGDPNDNSRWDIPTDWIDTASTIPAESDESESGDSQSGDSESGEGDATVTSDGETADAPATNESGVRFRASATITVSVTTGPYTAPDGSTGTTTSLTFAATGSVVIMVSGSWSTGDEGNTGTVLTGNEAGEAGPATPPSAAESSMTRAPRELVLGGNGTSVSASGEYFSYAYATIAFSVTISKTTMDNDAPGGGLSAPSASLNLSLGSGSFSTDQSDITVQESSTSGSGSNAKSVQVKEKNVSGSATSFALNLSSEDNAGDDAAGEGDAGSSDTTSPSPFSASFAPTESPGNDTAAESPVTTTEEEDGPLSFSSSSFNSQQKTTLYATQSSQQSASSQSSSSTKADIEDSSSGSTSLSFSINGFDYETTSRSKSEFSYLSESQSTSDPPTSSDGTPGSRWESQTSHVIETLEESERTFGFGFGSDGFDVTNEYSANETVSDVLKGESKGESWRLVYPTLSSSLAMSADNPPPAPYWVAGPELEMGSEHNIQYQYGGNLEDGFEGSYSDTSGFYQESLNQDGTVHRYEYTLTVAETFPNTNDGDESNAGSSSGDGSGDMGGAYSGADADDNPVIAYGASESGTAPSAKGSADSGAGDAEWYEGSWNPWAWLGLRTVPNWIAGYEPSMGDTPIVRDVDKDGLPTSGPLRTGSNGTYFGQSYDQAGKAAASHAEEMVNQSVAKAATTAGFGAFGRGATAGGRSLTNHATESLVRHGFKPPFGQIDEIIKRAQWTAKQADGAIVHILKQPGGGRSYSIVVEGAEGIVTAMKDLSPKALGNLARNYGFNLPW